MGSTTTVRSSAALSEPIRRGTGTCATVAGQFTTIDFPGAFDTNAYGVNNAGDILGDFQDAMWHVHGFIATVPAEVAERWRTFCGYGADNFRVRAVSLF
jgi:hypothetical protein